MFAFLLLSTCALAWRGARRRYLAAGAALLFLYCWPPVSMQVWRAVQSGYSRRAPEPGAAGAIVVLSGAVHQPFAPRDWSLAGANTFERCDYAVRYYHQVAPLPLLLVGGKVDPTEREPYSSVMKALVVQAGVPESFIWLEAESRSTAENAIQAARILRQRNIDTVVLVTDVGHMNRASRCFAKQGIRVIPAPCGFRPVYDYDANDFLPSWRAILWNEELVHEWLGLAWYRLRGVA